jgi:hypothetical protein
MIPLIKTLSAWGTGDFSEALKKEIEQLDAQQLPLQQGLSSGSYALGDKIEAMVIGASEQDGFIRARVGIFYSGILAGCSCADDPTPVEPQPEYCEVQVEIDRNTAEATIVLLPTTVGGES